MGESLLYPDLKIDTDEIVWRGRFAVRLVRFRHKRFDGTLSGLRTWEIWERGRAVAMLPYDPVADRVVLIEQFRIPALAAGVDPVMMEVPAGLLDADEAPESAARREMQEEVGLVADRLHRIGDFVLTPGGCDERCTVYAARIVTPPTDSEGIAGFAGLAAEDEDIRVRVLPAPEAIAAAQAGRYPNAVTTLALLWLGSQRDRLRREWT